MSSRPRLLQRRIGHIPLSQLDQILAGAERLGPFPGYDSYIQGRIGIEPRQKRVQLPVQFGGDAVHLACTGERYEHYAWVRECGGCASERGWGAGDGHGDEVLGEVEGDTFAPGGGGGCSNGFRCSFWRGHGRLECEKCSILLFYGVGWLKLDL